MCSPSDQDKRTRRHNHSPVEFRKENETKEISEGKEPDRLTRDSVTAAGGHGRKSKDMWCWMEIVKEDFLPKVCLEAA